MAKQSLLGFMMTNVSAAVFLAVHMDHTACKGCSRMAADTVRKVHMDRTDSKVHMALHTVRSVFHKDLPCIAWYCFP